MGEIRFVGTGETRGYPYLVCKKCDVCIYFKTHMLSFIFYISKPAIGQIGVNGAHAQTEWAMDRECLLEADHAMCRNAVEVRQKQYLVAIKIVQVSVKFQHCV